jgi:hypothetical protein
MAEIPLSALWANLLLVSGTCGSGFARVELISRSMHPFAFAEPRGFIAMSALLAWPALWSRTRPACHFPSLPPPSRADNPGAVKGVRYDASQRCAQGTLVAVAPKADAGERS